MSRDMMATGAMGRSALGGAASGFSFAGACEDALGCELLRQRRRQHPPGQAWPRRAALPAGRPGARLRPSSSDRPGPAEAAAAAAPPAAAAPREAGQ